MAEPTFQERLDMNTFPRPPRADLGEPCPICGANVDGVSFPAENELTDTPASRAGWGKMHVCARRHNIFPPRTG
jgi:hypothetical protein